MLICLDLNFRACIIPIPVKPGQYLQIAEESLDHLQSPEISTPLQFDMV